MQCPEQVAQMTFRSLLFGEFMATSSCHERSSPQDGGSPRGTLCKRPDVTNATA